MMKKILYFEIRHVHSLDDQGKATIFEDVCDKWNLNQIVRNLKHELETVRNMHQNIVTM